MKLLVVSISFLALHLAVATLALRVPEALADVAGPVGAGDPVDDALAFSGGLAAAQPIPIPSLAPY